MQRPWANPAWSLHFGGTRRQACTQSRRLITRRSQVQILPPLLKDPGNRAFRFACGRAARTGSMAQIRKAHRDEGTAEALQAEVEDRLASDVLVDRRVCLLAEQDLAGSRD